MSQNAFKIMQTKDGHFVLLKYNRQDKSQTEEYRSHDLNQVVERLLDVTEYDHAAADGPQDYAQVLEGMKALIQRYPECEAEDFPGNWIDPLELYGCYLQELIKVDLNLDLERKKISSLVFNRGAEWVWRNRQRLIAEQIFSLSSDN